MKTLLIALLLTVGTITQATTLYHETYIPNCFERSDGTWICEE